MNQSWLIPSKRHALVPLSETFGCRGVLENFKPGSFQWILSGGMAIHFLSIGRVLKPNHTFVDVLQIGVEIDRGNSESQMKSQRLGAVWSQKKHHSPQGLAITNKLPGWLDGKTGSPMIVNKAKAKVVQRIFEMAASGIGKRLIARRLNEEKVPTFGDAVNWGRSKICRSLESSGFGF